MSQDILKLYQDFTKNRNSTDVINSSQTNSSKVNSLNFVINEKINNRPVTYNNINQSIPGKVSSTGSSTTYNYDLISANEKLASLKRKREKCSKGLRHFSMKVCEKVKQKRVTTYNQVADELVNEYCSSSLNKDHQLNTNQGGILAASSINRNQAINNIDFWTYDQKNVRRRVYDALNVLMAMNIISKEKKEIKWIGLPCNKKQECQELETEKLKKLERIKSKSEILKALLVEHIALKTLIERNKHNENNEQIKYSKKINFPFLLINTDSTTNVDCMISNNKKEYAIQFDNTFQIDSHLELLKKLGFSHNLGEIKKVDSNENDQDKLKEAESKLPKLFQQYVKQLASSNTLSPICFELNLPSYTSLVKKEIMDSLELGNIDKQSKNKSGNNKKVSNGANQSNKNLNSSQNQNEEDFDDDEDEMDEEMDDEYDEEDLDEDLDDDDEEFNEDEASSLVDNMSQ